MLILAGFDLQNFGGGGRGHLCPRSRSGVRPQQSADRSDPVSLAIGRDGLIVFVRSLCGGRILTRHPNMWGSAIGAGARRANSARRTVAMQDSANEFAELPFYALR
jgi:hypothetical protein